MRSPKGCLSMLPQVLLQFHCMCGFICLHVLMLWGCQFLMRHGICVLQVAAQPRVCTAGQRAQEVVCGYTGGEVQGTGPAS